MQTKRVSIIGISASGKSIFSRKERTPTLQALKHADPKKLVIAHWPQELKTISKKYFQFE